MKSIVPPSVTFVLVDNKWSRLYPQVDQLSDEDLFHCFRFHISFKWLLRDNKWISQKLGCIDDRYREENQILQDAKLTPDEIAWICISRNCKAKLCVNNFRLSAVPELYIEMYEKQFEVNKDGILVNCQKHHPPKAKRLKNKIRHLHDNVM